MQFEALAAPDVTIGILRQEAWMDRPIARGRSDPLGATLRDGGANFSVFSNRGAGVELCSFNHMDDARPARVIALNPRMHRAYHYWHVFVPSITPDQLYARCISYCAIGRSNRHGVKLKSPDWNDHFHRLAATSAPLCDQFLLLVIVNAYWEVLKSNCRRSPEPMSHGGDVSTHFLIRLRMSASSKTSPIVPAATYQVQPRSLVILFAKARAQTLCNRRRPKETRHDRRRIRPARD
jgi:pullulanase/glycogen debranching enzyme